MSSNTESNTVNNTNTDVHTNTDKKSPITSNIKSIGKHTYGAKDIYIKKWLKTNQHQVTIGAFCSIAINCTIYLDGTHNTSFISTFPFGCTHQDIFTKYNGDNAITTKGDVIIGNNVYIGDNCTIMSGVTIGDGAIIAANSHVVTSVEPYSIYGGNPAKLIKYRFSEQERAMLKQIPWWTWDDKKINAILPVLMSGNVQQLFNISRISTNINDYYTRAKDTPSDINEHIETLKNIAIECSSIVEMGVRAVVSSWGFLAGLLENSSADKKLIGVDLKFHSNINILSYIAECNNIHYEFIQGDSAKVEIPEVDLLFIDTWHVYAHLIRELRAHHNKARKYIVMHDTTVDGEVGETIRCGWDAEQQSKDSGYPVDEINNGLWPAVEDFLKERPEWKLKHRYINNNGLTILERIVP